MSRCRSAICLCTSCSDHSWWPRTRRRAIATSMVAPLTKNAVRTTFVSGRLAAIRRFGCQAGTSGAAESLLFVAGGAIVRFVPDHQSHEPKPAELAHRGCQGVGDDDTARAQPRHGVHL